MNKWENVTSDVEITLTDEMRDELGLFDDAERLSLRVKHSGYDDPGNPYGCNDTARPPEWDCEISEIEGDVVSEDDDEEPLSAEQLDIIFDSSDLYDAIIAKIMEG